ncbi:MAG: DUF1566 domain-containing protein [Rhodoferax sp.]|nr:DUF1566 domain-containing protein [Rhodoferax sp.]
MNFFRRIPILVCCAWLTAEAYAAGEPMAATEARDIRTVQALNPLPHCMSSWPAMKDWLKHGLARAEDRMAVLAADMSSDNRWIRLGRNGQREDGKDTRAEVACIQDKVTQLVWAAGLEGKAAIRRFPGGPADISTQSLIERARVEQWCGKSDWKLPSKTQALSLVNYSRVRIDGEGTAWSQSGFPLVGSVWTDSRITQGERGEQQWTVSMGDGYTYMEAPIFQPGSDGQRHAALLVTSGSCTSLNREFAK